MRISEQDRVNLKRAVRDIVGIDDRRILEGTLSGACDAVPTLCAVATRMSNEIDRRLR